MRVSLESRAAEGGFGLIEIIVAMGTLLIGVLVYGGLTLTVSRGIGVSDERSRALDAARARMELLWSRPFEECFAAFDESTANDPPDAPGPHFSVPGLEPVDADTDGYVGRIRFPTGPGEDGAAVLREDISSPLLGMPRDLDGDGTIDGEPKDSAYVRLPVMVEVRWRGAGGEQRVAFSTLISPWRDDG
jgi:hypothetical protein